MAGLRRVRKYLIAHTVARVVYLCSATVICVGMIIDVIMVVNILMPYMRVVYYIPTICTHSRTVVANVQDCLTCPTANSTTKPCIQVYITYVHNTTDDGNSTTQKALLHLNEYNVLQHDVCSYNTLCTSNYWENAAAVEQFRRNYGTSGSNYGCYYDPTDLDRVILKKENSESEVMHALLWPSLAIGLGLILVIIFYCWVGCDIWGSRIATAMWDKSLKRIEMEQEYKRRQSSIHSQRKSVNSAT